MRVSPCIPVGYSQPAKKDWRWPNCWVNLASFSLVGRRWRSRGPRSCSRVAAGHRSGTPRVRSHYRFRNRRTEYSSVSGIKWISSSTKRQCDRALSRRTATAASCAPHRALHAPALRQHPGFPGPAQAPSTLGVDVKVIQPAPCIFCIYNH